MAKVREMVEHGATRSGAASTASVSHLCPKKSQVDKVALASQTPAKWSQDNDILRNLLTRSKPFQLSKRTRDQPTSFEIHTLLLL